MPRDEQTERISDRIRYEHIRDAARDIGLMIAGRSRGHVYWALTWTASGKWRSKTCRRSSAWRIAQLPRCRCPRMSMRRIETNRPVSFT